MASEKTEQQMYAKVKQTASEILLARNEEFIVKLQKALYPTEELKEICLNTLAYPNDLEIIGEMMHSLDEEKISEKLGIPVSIVRAKGKEYGRYKTWNVLKENEELRNLSFQVSNIEPAHGNDILTRLK